MYSKITPIDMKRKPRKAIWFLRPIIYLGSIFDTIRNRCKIEKINCKNLKWPYLIVANHASFLDFEVNELATFPHNTSYICSIEEFVGREWLIRGIGAFPKRKYTKDLRVVKNTLHCIKNLRNSVTIYSEARYTICGINERIDHAMGKLAKIAGVPVVTLMCHGNFLSCPHWDQKHPRKLRHYAEFKCIVDKDEIKTLTAEEIQSRIEKEFVYDDFKWQYDNKIKIKSKLRANNIHNALYKCPHCLKDYSMNSSLTELFCTNCGINYHMDEYSRLHATNGETKFEHVPDWYRWERDEVRKEIEEGTYHFDDVVRIEHLDNAKLGFRTLGHIKFTHDMDGIHLHGKLDDGTNFDFDNAPINTPSIHVEYNFKKKGTKIRGQAIDINTENDTWFIYPQTNDRVLTKIHLAVECLFDKASKE